jgi:hypothetical protein
MQIGSATQEDILRVGNAWKTKKLIFFEETNIFL